MAEYNFPDSLTVVKSVGKRQQKVGIKDDKMFPFNYNRIYDHKYSFLVEMTHHCGAR